MRYWQFLSILPAPRYHRRELLPYLHHHETSSPSHLTTSHLLDLVVKLLLVPSFSLEDVLQLQLLPVTSAANPGSRPTRLSARLRLGVTVQWLA